ncbi:MAG: hypothetical protein IJL39_02720 [Clostridia bacterium]|jgi:hypothetical protein|nr:hypothetical protein [Clostridia bacterium]MBQ6000961.1 hypothetical protein [Clostridia bacterium]MBQ6058955.1 hypothetical protein [Clostridia bacterium]
MSNQTPTFLQYKGKPFVRSGNMIYYGDLSDPCVVMLQILNSTKEGDFDMSGTISLMLMLTDESIPLPQRVLKKSEKEGLYVAMDLASIWLERALEEYAEGSAK